MFKSPLDTRQEARLVGRPAVLLVLLLWSVNVSPAVGTRHAALADSLQSASAFAGLEGWADSDCSLESLQAHPQQFQTHCLADDFQLTLAQQATPWRSTQELPSAAPPNTGLSPKAADEPQQVPEAPSLALTLLGLAGLMSRRWARSMPKATLPATTPAELPSASTWEPWNPPCGSEHRVLLSLAHHWIRRLPRSGHALQLCLHFPWTANHLASIWHRPTCTERTLDALAAGVGALAQAHPRLAREVERLQALHQARLNPKPVWPSVSPDMPGCRSTAAGTDSSPGIGGAEWVLH